MSYASCKFKLWGVFDGKECDLVQVSVQYAMNTIPSGVAVLPVGREVSSLQVAASHSLVAKDNISLPAKIYLQVIAGSQDAEALITPGTYVLFDGDVTAIGYKRTSTGLAMTLGLTHWLSALDFSSCLAESSHPGNPANFSFNATSAGGGERSGGFRDYCRPSPVQGDIDAAAFKEDLWGNGIKPWFLDLASEDRLFATTSQGELKGNDSKNGASAKALKRFSGVKLPFDLAVDSGGEEISNAIWLDITCATESPVNPNSMEGMANTTFWNKLVGDLAPRYMFSIIPRPDDALVVPFIPGLRSYWRLGGKYTVLARDLDFSDMSMKLARAIRGVGLVSGRGQLSGGWLPDSETTNDQLGGIYVARTDGLMLFKQAPRYMAECVVPSLYSDQTTGAVDEVKATAMHPDGGKAPKKTKPKEIIKANKNMLDKMAQAMYANEMLSGRTGQISGTVRMDIAPGSTILIEGTSGKFMAGSEPHGDPQYATASAVQLFFDAEQQQSGTGFQLLHMRTEAENKSDKTSIAIHPLYTQKWVGDRLVKK